MGYNGLRLFCVLHTIRYGQFRDTRIALASSASLSAGTWKPIVKCLDCWELCAWQSAQPLSMSQSHQKASTQRHIRSMRRAINSIPQHGIEPSIASRSDMRGGSPAQTHHPAGFQYRVNYWRLAKRDHRITPWQDL